MGSHKSLYATADQQDSQEFLSFLLDGIHEDLNRVISKPNWTKTPAQEAELETLLPQIASEQEWMLWQTRNDSIIVDFFQGQLRNRLKCSTCGQVRSLRFIPSFGKIITLVGMCRPRPRTMPSRCCNCRYRPLEAAQCLFGSALKRTATRRSWRAMMHGTRSTLDSRVLLSPYKVFFLGIVPNARASARRLRSFHSHACRPFSSST